MSIKEFFSMSMNEFLFYVISSVAFIIILIIFKPILWSQVPEWGNVGYEDVNKIKELVLKKIPNEHLSFVKRYKFEFSSDKKAQFSPSGIIKLKPGDVFIYIGHPQTFLLGFDYKENTISKFYPKDFISEYHYINKDPKNLHIRSYKVHSDTMLACGFFHPFIDMEISVKPQPEDKTYIYVLDEKLADHFPPAIYPPDRKKHTVNFQDWNGDFLNLAKFNKLALSFRQIMILGFTPLIFIIINCFFYYKIYFNIRRKVKPAQPDSLYNLFTYKKQRDFLCPHCTQPLNIFGQYKCYCGEISKEPQYIFKNCGECTHVFDKISCKFCGETVYLYEKTYNYEEIENRDKEYIARTNPMNKMLIFMGAISVLTYIFLMYFLTFRVFTWAELQIKDYIDKDVLVEIYYNIFGPHFFSNPLLNELSMILLFGLGAIVITTFSSFSKKKMLVRNPYE